MWPLLHGQCLYFVLLKWDVSCKFQDTPTPTPPRAYTSVTTLFCCCRLAFYKTQATFKFNIGRVLLLFQHGFIQPISLRNPMCAQMCTHSRTHIHLCKADTDFFFHQLGICFKHFDVNLSVKLSYKQQSPDFGRGEGGVILNNRSFFAPGNNLRETWGKMNLKPSCP